MIERKPTPVHIGMPELPQQRNGTESEVKKSSPVRVMLVGMQGEGGFSIHDPIGIGVIAKRIKTDSPQVPVSQIDTQPELARTGKIDTDELAARLHHFASETDNKDMTTVLGFGVPIYSVNYLQSTLLKYQQLSEENPPQGKVQIVLGGAVPTHTNTELVRELFPNALIVKGEGEERLSQIVKQATVGEVMTESDKTFEWADLQNYAGVDRTLTIDIMKHGGMPKTETSRGCGFGACSFCSRDALGGRGGKDYRKVPEEVVVEEMRTIQNLLDQFGKSRFELTDEDAFSDVEATQRLVSVMKAAQLDPDKPLRRMSFGASMRVETLNELATTFDTSGEVSMLNQLREVGLDKVFLGVEGGTDSFLKQIAKGQSMAEVAEAVQYGRSSLLENVNTGEVIPLEMEMGYIAFSYRQDLDILQDNVRFLSQVAGDPEKRESDDVTETNAQYVSALFNLLEVRAGTNDAKHLRRFHEIANDPTHREYQKYQSFKDYDANDHFNINTSTYEHVPFVDSRVGEIFKSVSEFAKADEALYYAVKSINRAASLPPAEQTQARDFYLRMKKIHLQFLRQETGLDDQDDIHEKRIELVKEIGETFGLEEQGDSLDSIRRETQAFLLEENERQNAEPIQTGAMLVARDKQGRMLLVRPRNQDLWAFPGGNVNEGEDPITAVLREAKEEIGVPPEEISIKSTLVQTRKYDHNDHTTGQRNELVLHHFEGEINGTVNIMDADHEIVDTIYLSPKEILEQKVKTRENVAIIASGFLNSNAAKETESQIVYLMQ